MVCFLKLWKDQKLNSQVQLEFHENVIYVSPGNITSPYYLVSTETKLNSSMEQRSCLVICQESLTWAKVEQKSNMSKSWYTAQVVVVVLLLFIYFFFFCLLCTFRVKGVRKKATESWLTLLKISIFLFKFYSTQALLVSSRNILLAMMHEPEWTQLDLHLKLCL